MKFHLTKVRECRRLTLWGWLAIGVFLALLMYVWTITIHNFLSPNKSIHAPILAIEGYVPDSAFDSIAIQFKQTSAQLLVCAGLPFDKGGLCSMYENAADYNAAVLRTKGIDSLQIVSAPCAATNKERTYTTALAVKDKLKKLGYTSGNIDVVCCGTHGRRSLLLYSKALEPEWNVGVISLPNHTYDPQSWWHTSEGARDVVYEMFAYLYCVIFFHP